MSEAADAEQFVTRPCFNGIRYGDTDPLDASPTAFRLAALTDSAFDPGIPSSGAR